MASAGHYETHDGETVFVRNNNGKKQKNVRMGPNNTNKTVKLNPYVPSSKDAIDFSANTFEDNQSSKPNEQAQAAQTQLQDYISKYSKYKFSN